MIADRLHLGVAQLQQYFRSAGAVRLGQISALRQPPGGSVMRNGLLIRTMLLRYIAGRDPVPQRRTETGSVARTKPPSNCSRTFAMRWWQI